MGFKKLKFCDFGVLQTNLITILFFKDCHLINLAHDMQVYGVQHGAYTAVCHFGLSQNIHSEKYQSLQQYLVEHWFYQIKNKVHTNYCAKQLTPYHAITFPCVKHYPLKKFTFDYIAQYCTIPTKLVFTLFTHTEQWKPSCFACLVF